MELVKRPDNKIQPSPGQSLAIRRGQEGQADFVPHLDLPEVEQLARAASTSALTGKGDGLPPPQRCRQLDGMMASWPNTIISRLPVQ